MLQKVLKTQTPALHTDRARVLPGKYELHRHLNVPNINPETGKIDTITGYCAVVTERRRGIERRVAI